MTSILDGALERGPFAAEGGRTDAAFERAVLADGQPVVVKHVSPDGLIARATGGADRLYRLWEAGIFARVPPPIDHTTIAMEPVDDGWIIVMRDASDAVLGDNYVLTRDESRRVLGAVDALHREFWDEAVADTCSVAQYFKVFYSIRDLADDFPIAKLFARGWELFDDVAPPDVTQAIQALLSDPTALARQLDTRPKTLIHGDLRLHNLGLRPDRVVLLDWEIIATAPPAVEFAWYLIISATRIRATREEIIEDFRVVSGERFDPYALELALVGALGMLGWNKALDIVDNPDPAIRAQERADLDWWIARVRRALETWSPV